LNDRKIILDTDMGIDDAVAVIVLLKLCKERIKTVFTSYGNTSLENATQNALAMLSLAGAVNIPVVCGAEKPGPGNGVYEDAGHIHGEDGLGGLRGVPPLSGLKLKEAIKGDYLQIIYDAIIEEDKIDYIALGPLTNLSALIKRFPDVLNKIDHAAVMGGGIGMGNVTEFAEFNFYCDAESADHVLSVVPKLTLAELSLTTSVAFDLPRIAAVGEAGTVISKVMEAALVYNYHQCVAYGEPGSTMHDSAAVIAYTHPELFEFKTCSIRVECEKERYGESVLIQDGKNIRLAKKTDPDKILSVIAKNII